MSVAPQTIWQLLQTSSLLDSKQLNDALANSQAALPPDTSDEQIIQWLIEKKLISNYQGQVLLAGHSGPFNYGDYQVFDRVLKGAFAGCFQARHVGSGYPVLLKFVTPEVAADPVLWQQIVAQAKQQVAVNHPQVLRLFELVDLGSFRFAVLEARRGSPLQSKMSDGKRVSESNAAQLIQSAAIGLQAIHNAGQVHGNINLRSIFLNEGHCWIYRDPFQMPFVTANSLAQPDEGALLQADYSAPELALTSQPSVLTDVYSTGCVLYELLSGKRPFPEGDLASKISRHTNDPTEPLAAMGISAGLEQMVMYMMAKNPELRYRSLDAVASQLIPFSGKAVEPLQPVVSKRLSAFEAYLSTKSPTASAAVAPPPLKQSSGNRPMPSAQPVPPSTAAPSTAAPNTVAPSTVAPSTVAAKPVAAPSMPTPPNPAAPPASPFNAPAVTSGLGIAPEGAGSVTSRLRKKGPKISTLVGLGVAMLLLIAALGSGYYFLAPDKPVAVEDPVVDTDPTVDPNVDPQKNTDPVAAPAIDPDAGFVQQLVNDTGKELWETPTTGRPLELTYVPSGVRLLIAFRPAELLAAPDGELVFQALGAEFAALRANFEQQLGVKFADVEQILLTFHDNAGKAPRTALSVFLKDSVPKDQLLIRWKNPRATPLPEQSVDYYARSDEFAFLIPPDAINQNGAVSRFVVAAVDQITEMAGTGFAQPNLNTHFQKLLSLSDRERHFTAIAVPSFLYNDEGEHIFAGTYHDLLATIKLFVDRDIQAGMCSMHLQDDWYLEVMLKGQVDRDPRDLGELFLTRLKSGRDRIASHNASLGANAYWDQVRFAYALWIRKLVSEIRIGVEEKMMVANCWMPRPAAHNLISGSELVLASSGGGGRASTVAMETPAKSLPKTIEELLNDVQEVDIPEDDLVNAVADIKAGVLDSYGNKLDFRFDIVLIGPDLQTDGITQNQKVKDFKMNAPLNEILTALMVQANPDKKAKGPKDPLNKLIWVIGPDPKNPAEQILLITTRKAAARDKIPLPAAFVSEN
jgi:serine/threonine protein kinase